MNAPTLRLLGGGKPTRPVNPKPRLLSESDAKVYGQLCRRLSVVQAVDIATGIHDHGCTPGEVALLRRIMPLDTLPCAA